MDLIVRASSPSVALKRLMFWTKTCGSERVAIVENLVSDDAPGRETVFREVHPQSQHSIFGNQDNRPILANFVRYVLGFQLL